MASRKDDRTPDADETTSPVHRRAVIGGLATAFGVGIAALRNTRHKKRALSAEDESRTEPVKSPEGPIWIGHL